MTSLLRVMKSLCKLSDLNNPSQNADSSEAPCDMVGVYSEYAQTCAGAESVFGFVSPPLHRVTVRRAVILDNEQWLCRLIRDHKINMCLCIEVEHSARK